MGIQLGKIESISFGYGGYDDAMIGITVCLACSGGSVMDFRGAWSLERGSSAAWTEETRLLELGRTVMWLNTLLIQAKVKDITQLKGKPVEVTFENGNRLNSWRLLTEVL